MTTTITTLDQIADELGAVLTGKPEDAYRELQFQEGFTIGIFKKWKTPKGSLVFRQRGVRHTFEVIESTQSLSKSAKTIAKQIRNRLITPEFLKESKLTHDHLLAKIAHMEKLNSSKAMLLDAGFQEYGSEKVRIFSKAGDIVVQVSGSGKHRVERGYLDTSTLLEIASILTKKED